MQLKRELTIQDVHTGLESAKMELTLSNYELSIQVRDAADIIFSITSTTENVRKLIDIAVMVESAGIHNYTDEGDLITEILFCKLATYLLDSSQQSLAYAMFSNLYNFYNMIYIAHAKRFSKLLGQLSLAGRESATLSSDFDGDLIMPGIEYASRRQALHGDQPIAAWGSGGTTYSYEPIKVFRYFTVTDFDRIIHYIETGIANFARRRERTRSLKLPDNYHVR